MKWALFTDIHWGARGNSDEHLKDCSEYIDWFCDLVKSEKAEAICFLGDWFESRNAINIKTLNASQNAARKLSELGIPVYIIVGNHDLYHRSSRTVFSTDSISDLPNINLISHPTEINKEIIAIPYLFKEEYAEYAGLVNSHKYVFGHLEFRNFVVSGSDRILEHGPDASQFSNPKYLLCGHFHKRQASGNVVYIGNTFPTNYGDAGDPERGAAILDTETENLEFINYEKAPLFFKTRLSRILDGEIDFPPRSRVWCLLDMPITYSEVQSLREELMGTLELREFRVEEDANSIAESLEHGLTIDGDIDLSSLDNTVRQLILEGVVTTTGGINPESLVNIYDELQTET